MFRIILKKLFFLLSMISYLYGDVNLKEIKIHDSIAKSIFSSSPIKTYISSPQLREKILAHSRYLELTAMEDSSYVILSDDAKITNAEAIVFVTNYKLLKKHKNAIGAFYWKKGRPTIVFIKERLDRYSLELSSSFEKYYENEKCLYELCF